MLAPVALFVYNRPWHTRQTVAALAQNEQAGDTDLFVFSDAGKRESDAGRVAEVRDFIRQIRGFKSVTIVERAENYGLSRSIISGVTEVLASSDTIIVVEDDLVTSRYFLTFMNGALDRYRDASQVISIHGYVYPVAPPLPETFFLKGADCWGWGTWRRGWELFDPDGRRLLEQLKARGLSRRFDFNGAHGFTRMLKDQIAGKNDSWAVRWYASALLNDKLTLYPGRSLVQNIGNDNSGTNCGETGMYRTQVACEPLVLTESAVVENEAVLRHFERYFRSCRVPLYKRVMRRLGGGREMKEHARELVAPFLPPILLKFLGRCLKRPGYSGDFPDWEAARAQSEGYEAAGILEKVRDALKQVKSGAAAYERDSVLFDEVQYAWPLLAGLLWIASRSGNHLNVLDFGGSLGSSYFQNRRFISHLARVQWSIVEQRDFVLCGEREFADEVLKFFPTVEECIAMRAPDTLLLSSVLPYLESPYEVLSDLLSRRPAYVIIDRTPFIAGDRDRLTVQKVPAEIYGGSYPAWFFSKSAFLQFMQKDYQLVAEFDALAGNIDLGDDTATDKGFIFELRNH